MGVTGDGSAFVWLAGEAGVLASMRRLVREVGIPEDHHHLAGYWKLGTADAHD